MQVVREGRRDRKKEEREGVEDLSEEECECETTRR